MPDKDGKELSGKQLFKILTDVYTDVKSNIVITEEFKGYNFLRRTNCFTSKIDHEKAYVNGMVHTNNIESFWANLKRGIYGIYHHVSVKYLKNYINEFCFGYNNRNEDLAFDLILE